MDWDTLHRTRYSKSIERLTFEPRPATCFSMQGSTPHNRPSSTSFLVEDLPDEASLQRWLSNQRAKPTNTPDGDDWSLTVLALQRGPPNEFELRKEGALDQLQNVGCTQRHFEEILDISSISKAFPECFDKDTSLVYSKQSKLLDSNPNDRCLDIIMRGDPTNLQDMAFGLSYFPGQSQTFAIIHGCTDTAIKELKLWLPAMQDYFLHPLLMINLFLELHRRRVEERARDLRVQTSNLSFEVFGYNEPEVPTSVIQHQKDLVSNVNRLGDQIGVVGNELIELRLRLADMKSLFNEVDEAQRSFDRVVYSRQHGSILMDNLTRLDQRIESLQAKNASMRANAELLLPAIFNVIAMKDSQINKEMAAAARRDSSVMVGITVGTLTFFPSTAMATIFALPVFNWDAAPGENITDRRFWIYLAVTIPLTMVTLLILATWLFLSDKASKEFITVREYVNRFGYKGFLQTERRRIAAKFKTNQAEAEKICSFDSPPEA